jgi:hypothetical protein
MSQTGDRSSALALACAVAIALAGCSGGGGEGTTSTTSRTGSFSLGISDAPIDHATNVVIRFTGVEFKPRDGVAFSRDFATARDIDLLQFQGTNRAMLFDGESLEAGEYEWMRLKVAAEPNVVDSYINLDGGGQCELRVPSGAETGLKLVRGFTVGVGNVTDLTIDFDVRQSIVQPPGLRSEATDCGGQNYLLRPALRVVDTLEVGTISGNVDVALRSSTECAASAVAPGSVYLFGPFSGTDPAPVPDDYDTNDADGMNAITSALVDEATGDYTIGFVPAGKYVVAYTCDADDVMTDADTTPPAVTFTPATGAAVDVVKNAASTVNFAPDA